MKWLRRLFQRRKSGPDLESALTAFLQAETWTESLRVLEEHPEMLSDQALGLLERLVAEAHDQGQKEVARYLEEHLRLLRHAAQVGVEQAVAEAEEALARWMAFQDLLEDAGALGKTLRGLLALTSPQEHRAYLEAHPELLSEEGLALLERLVEATPDPQIRQGLAFFLQIHRRAAQVGVEQTFAELTDPDLPAELRSLVQQAKEAEAHYRRTGDRQALDRAVALWEQILNHPALQQADARARLAVLNDAGTAHLYRYWARGQMAGLDRALTLWQQAVRLTPEGSPDLPSILNNLALGLRDRYARTGDLADLEQAIAHWQEAVRLTPEGSPDLPGFLNNLANGLRARYA
ncbi:MAG: hypothetical protein GXO54_01880, partial [Chloroflexi bacterium]|nr:hypothetical protein [Chloroflexota bacterium]